VHQSKAVAEDPDTIDPIAGTLAYYFTPTRRVTIAPFLLEVAPRPIAEWSDALASAFRWPRALWEDVVTETMESAWVRRARSIG